MHDYQLSQNYLERAKAAGAPDAEVRIGLANNYLALGDTTRAKAELAAVNASADDSPDYQYLLAQANVFRQEHQDAQALTSFAQASNAEGEDQTSRGRMLAGRSERRLENYSRSELAFRLFRGTYLRRYDGLRAGLKARCFVPWYRAPTASASAAAIFPRDAVDRRLPSSSWPYAHRQRILSVAECARADLGAEHQFDCQTAIRRTTRSTSALNPTVHLGDNVLQFNSGIQETVRRDSKSPVAMNQNLFRVFTYMSTSSFFNAVSVNGYVMRESRPIHRKQSAFASH